MSHLSDGSTDVVFDDDNSGLAVTESKSPRFRFVLDKSQAGTRSHAMREYWKQRQKRKHERQPQQTPRRLLPSTAVLPTSASDSEQPIPPAPSIDYEYMERLHFSQQQSLARSVLSEVELLATEIATEPNKNAAEVSGIPAQVMTRMDHALAGSRLDPFDTFPIKLTGQHHKLLHHWLSTYAAMMFEDLPITSFNPMKDVWFPLDLSNAASFNGIMAHSAAHLAHLHGGTYSADALRYKEEALSIINTWLTDPTRALSDETFAAVVRLLTFERYWGTEAEWKVHRNGLQQMVEARGGLDALRDNWRLELVVCLISLMVRPSWFDSSNHIWEMSEHPDHMSLHPIFGTIIDLHKVRCLWLISFIQDMRTLMGSSSQLYMEGLGIYPAVHSAVLLLHSSFQQDDHSPMQEAGGTVPEYDRLACLLFICVVLQESISLSYNFTGTQSEYDSFSRPFSNGLAILDVALLESRDFWKDSVGNLHSFIFNHFINLEDGTLKTKYCMQMTDVLEHVSHETRRGVEKCLLNMLCRTKGGRMAFSVEDGWTPESLLSSIHGE
ncbi:fungal-specific transcription factor domain-containing protein [Lipomyces starkeyi]